MNIYVLCKYDSRWDKSLEFDQLCRLSFEVDNPGVVWTCDVQVWTSSRSVVSGPLSTCWLVPRKSTLTFNRSESWFHFCAIKQFMITWVGSTMLPCDKTVNAYLGIMLPCNKTAFWECSFRILAIIFVLFFVCFVKMELMSMTIFFFSYLTKQNCAKVVKKIDADLLLQRGILKGILCLQKANQSSFEILSHWHPNLTINLLDDHSPWIHGSVPQPLDECEFPVLFLHLFLLMCHESLTENLGRLAWVRLQKPLEWFYPVVWVCSVFSYVQTMVWLPVFGNV